MNVLKLLLFGLLPTLAFAADPASFKSTLTPDGVKPGMKNPPKNSRGSIEAILKGKTLFVEGSYKYLTTNAQAIQLRAGSGSDAAIVCSLKPKYNATNTPSFGKMGECPLSDDQIDELKAGHLFMNITSITFPDGEVRGQLLQAK